MAQKLKVKQELLDKDAEVAFSANGGSYQVKLKEATKAQLELMYKSGLQEIFEAEKPEKER